MTWLWVGVAEPDHTRIAVKTDAEAAVVLRVSTDVSFGAYTDTGPQNTDDDDGRVTQFVLTGLTPDTTYYVRVLVDDVVQESEGRFRTYPVGPASFAFGAASCSDTGADNGVYEDIRDAGLTFFVHMGDLHYLNINEAVHATGVAAHRAGYDASVGIAQQQKVFARVSTPRMWDDHDYSGNNSDGASTGKAAALQTFREAVPVPAAEADGVFYAFTAGRLRVLVLDTRSEREAGDFLGATQEAWLKTECLAAKANGHAIVLCAGVPWIASSGDDTWAGAATQRTRLATFFEDHALDSRILMVSGDMHAVALDDGTNNAWGGFPVLHAAALYRTGSYKGGPYQLGPFHRGTSGGGGPIDSGQWGKVAVTDDGGQSISLTLSGMRNDAVINEQARDSGGSLTGSTQLATLTVSLRAGFDRPVIISPTDDRDDPLAVAQVVTFEEAGTGTRMLSTIAVDRTGLGAGTAYVFVQDDAGAWNESGFPVTLRRRVVLSPTNDHEDADAVEQSVTDEEPGDGTRTLTTISAQVGDLTPGAAYVFIEDDDGQWSEGYAVTLTTGGGFQVAWGSAAVTNDFSFAQTAAVGNRPTGVTADDGLVALTVTYGIAPASAPTVTPPTGWTEIGTADVLSLSGGAFNVRAQFWRKLAGGSEPSTYTWTLSAAGGWQVEIVAVDNVKTSGFVQGRTAINVGTGTAVQALGLTTDQTNQYVLMFAATGATATFTAPGTMTERYDVANNFIADEQRATPGATGTRTATASASGEWTAWLVALYSEDSAPPSSGPPMAVLRHHYALMQRR